jgi:hypothetical protein
MSLSLSLHSTEFFAVAGAEFLNFCFQILTSTRTQKPKEKTEKKKLSRENVKANQRKMGTPIL